MATTFVDLQVSHSVVGNDPNLFQGTSASFKITVVNAPYADATGVSHAANGAFIQNILPGGLTATNWTAVYNGGASGPVSGNGTLQTNIPVFPAGSSVVYTVNVDVRVDAGLGYAKNTALASVGAGLGLVNPKNGVGSVGLNLLKRRSTVTVNNISSGPFERGRSVDFVTEIINSGPVPVLNGQFYSEMSDGLRLVEWSATYANGATGKASGRSFPAYNNLPVNGRVTYTVTAWIEPDACLGATSNVGVFNFPSSVDNIDGSGCQKDILDFQVLEPSSRPCVNVGNCLSGWACDDVTVPGGHVLIRLVTPDNVPAFDPGRGRTLTNATYRAEIDGTGCWVSPDLPLNSQLITKSTGEAIPSYYEVYEYVTSMSSSATPYSSLVGTYRFRLSSDNTYTGIISVRELDEFNPSARVCVVS